MAIYNFHFNLPHVKRLPYDCGNSDTFLVSQNYLQINNFLMDFNIVPTKLHRDHRNYIYIFIFFIFILTYVDFYDMIELCAQKWVTVFTAYGLGDYDAHYAVDNVLMLAVKLSLRYSHH